MTRCWGLWSMPSFSALCLTCLDWSIAHFIREGKVCSMESWELFLGSAFRKCLQCTRELFSHFQRLWTPYPLVPPTQNLIGTNITSTRYELLKCRSHLSTFLEQALSQQPKLARKSPGRLLWSGCYCCIQPGDVSAAALGSDYTKHITTTNSAAGFSKFLITNSRIWSIIKSKY